MAAQQLDLFGGGPSKGRNSSRRTVLPAETAPDLVKLARAIAPTVRLGTSSWSFPGWVGSVYEGSHPERTLARGGLGAYAQHPLFRTVGIDRTHYGTVDASDLARYRQSVPQDFRFMVKAHSALMTPLALENRRSRENARFLDPDHATDAVIAPYIDGLGENGGILLFQFAASLPRQLKALWGPDATDARFADALERFLSSLPAGPRYAVELRSPELLTGRYRDALEESRAVHCFNVHPAMPAPTEQLKILSGYRGPRLLVRWLLANDLAYESAVERYHPFDHLVDEDTTTRRAIATMVRESTEVGLDAYVIVNNKAEGSAPLSLASLAGELVSSS